MLAPTSRPRAAVDSRCRRARSEQLQIFFSKRRPFLTVSTRANLSCDVSSSVLRTRDLRLLRNYARRRVRRGSAESRKFARSVYLYSRSPCVIFSFCTERRDLRPSRESSSILFTRTPDKHPARLRAGA